jgi:diguanylate cyclase (GGDEF)-like protein
MNKTLLERLFGSYLFNIKKENNRMDHLLIIGFLVLYIFIMFLQANLQKAHIQGLIAQIQVISSVFIVVRLPKMGARAAVAVNGVQTIMIFIRFLVFRNLAILPGFVITISTIIIAMTIYSFHIKIEEKYEEIEKQKNAYMNIYTRLMEHQEQLNALTYYDSTTNIPNRNMVFNHMEKLIRGNAIPEQGFAVLIFDIDDFKLINNRYGHRIGDQVLKLMANRLKENIEKDDFFGRFGGDEFILFVQHTNDRERLEAYARKLQEVIKSSLMLGDLTFVINSSVGATLYPNDTTDYNKIFQYAETALMTAKQEKKHGLMFFDQGMENMLKEKIRFSTALKNSIANGELYVMYQPQFEIAPKRIRGFEVLARWESPVFGQVSPLKFIAEAEECDFIHELGEWVLRTACQRIVDIKKSYNCQEGSLSINISPLQLKEPYFLKMVKDVMQEYDIEGKELEFEITESIFMKPTQKILDVLHILRSMGIRIALDDFGTGYSSLNYLQKLPVDILKIDKTFIDNIESDSVKLKMVGNIVKMAHDMNYRVIAEGVEHMQQVSLLDNYRCDYIQGYIWGKPLQLNEMNAVMAEYCKSKKK